MELVLEASTHFFELIDGVPVEWEPEIFEANTPFTSYLKIRQCLAAVSGRVHYFDRYLKPDFFDLFLRDVSRAVSVRLVTTKSSVNLVASVSELCSGEFSNYQLVQVDPGILHDRNLRVDDAVFSLGPGVDQAGIALTNFGPADDSPSAHAALDEIIVVGTVVHQSS